MGLGSEGQCREESKLFSGVSKALRTRLVGRDGPCGSRAIGLDRGRDTTFHQWPEFQLNMYKALRREERVGQRLSPTGHSPLESRDMERSGEDIKGELEVERTQRVYWQDPNSVCYPLAKT